MEDKYRHEYLKQAQQFATHHEDKWTKKRSEKEWQHEASMTAKKPKPDPATVEAALRLEEQLWAS
jgi:hypothetical protein